MSKAEVIDSLTPQEVQAVTAAKQKAILANAEAEKAVALSRLSESEAKNLILQIYNKYDLKIGQDQVLETGKIVRKQSEEAALEKVVADSGVEEKKDEEPSETVTE